MLNPLGRERSEIPVIDIRGKGPEALLDAPGMLERANALMDAVAPLGAIKPVSRFLTRLGDNAAKAWLEKTGNPYLDEIGRTAEKLGRPGGYAAALSYEWGCTSGAYQQQDDSMVLGRILDWHYPLMGQTMIVARQDGGTGEYYNVTWAQSAGQIIQGMKPGVCAVAINQAPGRFGGFPFLAKMKERGLMNTKKGMPASHLLRNVFDKSKTYVEAARRLIEEPIAMPTIFTIVGTQPREGMIIERLEDVAVVRRLEDGAVRTCNHFLNPAFNKNAPPGGWRPRGTDSYARFEAAECNLTPDAITRDLAWAREPNVNKETCAVMVFNPAAGTLSLKGMDGTRQVTQLLHLAA